MNEFRQLDVKAVAITLLRLFTPWSKSVAWYKLQRNYWRCWFSFLRVIDGKWKCWWAYKRQHVTWVKVLSLVHLPMRIWKSWAKLNLIFIRKVSKSFFKIKFLSSNVLLATTLEIICINLLSASPQLIRKLWLDLNFLKFMNLKTCLGLIYVWTQLMFT